MKRFFLLLTAIAVAITATAQTPEAVRESIRKYPNLAVTTYSTYPSIPLGEIAKAPEGFEPFYFSLVGRHGSRYYRSESRFNKTLAILHKADSLNILTDLGKRLHKKVAEIAAAQKGRSGELTPLGYQQWLGIAHRAYEHFTPVFESGSVEGKSSTSYRCIFSMAAFNQGLKEKNPKLGVVQDARKIDLPIIRPLYDNPNTPKLAQKLHKSNQKGGELVQALDKWMDERDMSAFIDKITTDRKALLKVCGGKNDARMARYSIITLLFAENFELGDRKLLSELFTTEDLYSIYIYQTTPWVNCSLGRGHEEVEMYTSYMRPMVDDIISKGNEAIAGKNPHCANVRFTHDSYVGPLLSVMGYEGCVAKYNNDLELAATSFNHGMMVPMAANLQVVLYRNKAGEVLVRSLVNERDGYLPIKCATAPFYPWKEFCKYLNKNFEELEKSQKVVLKKYQE